jgi:hypothetical protein
VYKYLGPKGSVLQIRLILIATCIVLFALLFSAVKDSSNQWVYVFLGTSILYCVCLFSALSVVKHNHSEIVIVNIWGETRYQKRDLQTVRPLLTFLPLYVIVFKDEKSYRFSTTPGSIIGFTDAIKEADQIKVELLSVDNRY